MEPDLPFPSRRSFYLQFGGLLLAGWLLLMGWTRFTEWEGATKERLSRAESRSALATAARVRAERKLDSALAQSQRSAGRYKRLRDSVTVAMLAADTATLREFVDASDRRDRACTLLESACGAFRDSARVERAEMAERLDALNTRVRQLTIGRATSKLTYGVGGFAAGYTAGRLSCGR